MSVDQSGSEKNYCFDNGVLVNGQCKCDLEYFGARCEEGLQSIHFEAYITFIGVYGLLFLIIFLMSIQQLQISIQTNKIPAYYKKCEYIQEVMKSPKNYILVLTILFCIFKLLWLAMDPFQVYQFEQRVIERNIAEIVYSILFFIYGILLMVWYSMYDDISYNVSEEKQKENRKWIFKYYKDIMKVRLGFVLIIQLGISTINGLRLSQNLKILLYIFYAIMLINFISFIFEFLIYGRSLHQLIEIQLEKCKEQIKQEMIHKSKQFESFIGSQSLKKDEKNVSIRESQSSIKLIGSKPNSPSGPTIKIIQEEDEINQQAQEIQKIGRLKNVRFARTYRMNSKSDSQFRQESLTNISKKQQTNRTISEESNPSDQINFEEKKQLSVNKDQSCLLEESYSENIQITQSWQTVTDRGIINSQIENQINLIKTTKANIQKIKFQKRKQTQTSTSDKYQTQEFVKNQNKIQEDIFKRETKFQQDMLLQLQNNKTSTLNLDRMVLRKIQLLIYFGAGVEICFIALTLCILFTTVIETPQGTLIYLYISGMLQFLSLFAVLKLFKDVKSQEILNLIWIQKVGNKRSQIHKKYFFCIPDEFKRDDDTKIKFENRINMNI